MTMMATICGFTAQLFSVSHHYREVTSSNSIKVLDFSGLSTQKFINAKISLLTPKLRSQMRGPWRCSIYRSSMYDYIHISLRSYLRKSEIVVKLQTDLNEP